jgi:hypothetical protein
MPVLMGDLLEQVRARVRDRAQDVRGALDVRRVRRNGVGTVDRNDLDIYWPVRRITRAPQGGLLTVVRVSAHRNRCGLPVTERLPGRLPLPLECL